jgi:hypothetical protein
MRIKPQMSGFAQKVGYRTLKRAGGGGSAVPALPSDVRKWLCPSDRC